MNATIAKTAPEPASANAAEVPRWALAIALGMGLLEQMLWWGWPAVGLNALVGTLASLAAWLGLLRARGAVPRGTRGFLLLAVIWAALPAWRGHPALIFWAWLAWMVTLFLALARYFPGDAWQATLFGWLRMVGYWLRALFPDTWRTALAARGEQRFLARHGLALALGLALLMPIGLCFAGLLAMADPVFEHYLAQWFSFDTWWEWVGRALLAGFFGWAWLAGLLVAWRSAATAPADAPGPRWNRLPWVSTAVVLGGVLLLFVAFLGIQARYLFGGEAALQAFDLTYAQYARRGFGELVAVVMLFLGLLVAADAFTARPTPGAERGFRALAWASLVAVALMLASAAYRLGLYVAAFGLTATRFQVAVFMAWLLVALAWAAWTVRQPGPHRWPRVGLAPFFAFVLTLAVLDPAAWVVRVNLRRAAQGQSLDVAYLLSDEILGPEIWVTLETAYQSPQALPEAVRQRLGAAVACRAALHEWQAEEAGADVDAEGPLSLADWRGWSWARWQGRMAYERLARETRQDFPVRMTPEPDTYGTWQRFEVQVNGRWRSCYDMAGFVDPYIPQD